MPNDTMRVKGHILIVIYTYVVILALYLGIFSSCLSLNCSQIHPSFFLRMLYRGIQTMCIANILYIKHCVTFLSYQTCDNDTMCIKLSGYNVQIIFNITIITFSLHFV